MVIDEKGWAFNVGMFQPKVTPYLESFSVRINGLGLGYRVRSLDHYFDPTKRFGSFIFVLNPNWILTRWVYR